MAERTIADYASAYPSAMRPLEDDLEVGAPGPVQ
jgi:hypothetical protein